MRIIFPRQFHVFLGALLLAPVEAALALNNIDAYLGAFSAQQGGTVGLHVSTDSSNYNLDVYRLGAVREHVFTQPNLVGSSYAVPAKGWLSGASWPKNYDLSILDTWKTGLYEIDLSVGSTHRKLPFMVSENMRGSTARTLVLDNALTDVAYNNWGGKSLYDYNSTSNTKATSVSLLRPLPRGRTIKQEKFIGWAETNNIPLEYASQTDLQTAGLLDNYNTVVITGHNEYWTKEMRDNFDAFVQGGGNAIILGGNTMWWQARLEGDQMVAYKNAQTDPMYGADNTRVTTNWYKDPVNAPENTSIGVSWRNGGYVNLPGTLPASEGYGGYTVRDNSHWVFNGTGLQNGDVFGQASTIVGYEADGALFTLDSNGNLVVTGADGTPLNFQILATSPAKTSTWNGTATMGIFQSGVDGGYVFNAATVDWVDGLWSLYDGTIPDAAVSQITYNVFENFGATTVPVPPSIYFLGSGILLLLVRHRMNKRTNLESHLNLMEPHHCLSLPR